MDATAFLKTLFKLYPTATEKELAYYVAENALEVPDNQTNATQISQYDLILHKDENWKIIE